MGATRDPAFVFALALGAGMTGHLVARHLRVPSIVVLLGAGLALGPDGLEWVVPRALDGGLLALVRIAVGVILFEGALNLDLRQIRRSQSAIRMLVTLGALVTAAGGTLAAHLVMGWEWQIALLFGTLVIVTGPTVIRPILRNVALRRRLATVLEAEGVFIDPVGAVIAAVTLEVVLVPSGVVGFGLPDLAVRLGFGTLAGLVVGFLFGLVLRAPRIVPEGLENLFTLGAALVLYEGCNAVLSESGILAVTVAGVVIGNMRVHVARELREFEEHLTVGLIGILFVLLAADVRLADVQALGWAGIGTVAALVFLVRPANVFLSTAWSDLDLREKLFLSWTAPRGIVAAAVASLAAVLMEDGKMAGGTELRALVFLTIAITVVLQGGTAPWMARLLGVRAPGRDAIAILGAEELALTLGDALRNGEGSVVFIDANPGHCRTAEERGFVVVFGNALDERVLNRAKLERCRAAIGLTANDEVNALFAREARDDYDVPETYVSVSKGSGVTSRILAKQASRAVFDGPKDVERWNVRLRHGSAELLPFRYVGAPEGEAAAPAAGSAADAFLVLVVERADTRMPMHADLELKADDRAQVAVHLPERDHAEEALARLGWQPAPPDAGGDVAEA